MTVLKGTRTTEFKKFENELLKIELSNVRIPFLIRSVSEEFSFYDVTSYFAYRSLIRRVLSLVSPYAQ